MYLDKQVHLYFYYECLHLSKIASITCNFPWVYYVFLLAHYARKQVFLNYHVSLSSFPDISIRKLEVLFRPFLSDPVMFFFGYWYQIYRKLACWILWLWMKEISLSHLKCQSWGDQDDSELRNKKKRCKYQKQYVITIEHFRFQLYKVFLYSC